MTTSVAVGHTTPDTNGPPETGKGALTPIRILDARHDHAGTSPARLIVLFNRRPERAELRYTTYPVQPAQPGDLPATLYVAVTDGYVDYMLDDPTPGRRGLGCCGTAFDLLMTDGTHRRVVGPWSSRAAVVATVAPEVDVYLGEVVVHDTPTTFYGRGGGYVGALTNTAARRAIVKTCG